jgi:hypothetical protein
MFQYLSEELQMTIEDEYEKETGRAFYYPDCKDLQGNSIEPIPTLEACKWLKSKLTEERKLCKDFAKAYRAAVVCDDEWYKYCDGSTYEKAINYIKLNEDKT